MKKVIVVILAVVILVAIGVALLLKKDRREIKGEAENFIPADVLIYISQRGIGDDWEKLKDSDFWKETTSSQRWELVESKLRELQGELESRVGFALDEGSIKELFGREVALALFPGAGAGSKPQGLFLTRVGIKTKVQEHLVKIQDKLSGQGKLSSETYKGVKITNLKLSSPGLGLGYAFLSDWLVLGIGESNEVLKEAVDLYRGKSRRSLANNESFQDVRSRLPEERAGLLYLDMEKIRAIYPEKGMENIWRGSSPLKGLGRRINPSLGMFKSVGGTTWFDKGLKAKFCLLINREKADENLMGMFSGKPGRLESVNYVPQGTVFYAGGSSFDLGAYWKYLQKTLKEQSPQVAERMFKGIEGWATEWDLSLEEDVLSWMGDEFAYALFEVNLKGKFPRPACFLMLKVKDEEKARETLTELENILAQVSVKKQWPFPLKFDRENYEGMEIKILQVPMSTPGYAFVNDFLVISNSTPTIKRLIDTKKGKGSSLIEDADFERVKPVFKDKSNGLGYLNVEETLDIVRSLAAWSLSAQEQRLSRMKRTQKSSLESQEFATPEEKEKELEAFQQKLEMLEGRMNNIRKNMEEGLYPLLESLKVFQSLGIHILVDKESIEQTFYLAVEE